MIDTAVEEGLKRKKRIKQVEEKNEAGKAISSAKGVVVSDRIKNIRAVRKRAKERIKQVERNKRERGMVPSLVGKK
jgi:hypothetical protein